MKNFNCVRKADGSAWINGVRYEPGIYFIDGHRCEVTRTSVLLSGKISGASPSPLSSKVPWFGLAAILFLGSAILGIIVGIFLKS